MNLTKLVFTWLILIQTSISLPNNFQKVENSYVDDSDYPNSRSWHQKRNPRGLKQSSLPNDCTLNDHQQMLSVLPGTGWDNLVNQERGLTIDRESFVHCRTSADRKYIVPDDVIVEPIMHSEIKLSSEVFESINECRSLTSNSINSALHGGYQMFKINGDFSFEKESIREKLGQSRGLVVQSEIRHNRFLVRLLPDSKLNPRFKERLMDVAYYLEKGNVDVQVIDMYDREIVDSATTNKSFKSQTINEALNAFYLADLIVRDFGTHSISSIYIGAVLAKTDTLDKSSAKIKKEDRWKLASSARASFSSLIGSEIGVSTAKNVSLINSYEKTLTYSTITSHGGPVFQISNLSLSKWESNVDDNLVAIDRSGIPIFEIITKRSMPELSSKMIFVLTATLQAAVKRYYKANMVVGCTNPSSAYFDSEANIGSTECDDDNPLNNNPMEQSFLGGVYQTCQGPNDICQSELISNPATGQQTCPEGYVAVQLIPDQMQKCYENCTQHGWINKPECTEVCALVKTFWCSLDPSLIETNQPNRENGFLFGGLYTDKDVNPITGQFHCPEYYWPIVASRHIRLCLSNDHELGLRNSLHFGGFFSCYSGNPLTSIVKRNQSHSNNGLMADSASSAIQQRSSIQQWLDIQGQLDSGQAFNINKPNLKKRTNPFVNDYTNLFSTVWPKQCPTGYTAHLAAIENVCQVNYCLKSGVLKKQHQRELKRPPFVLPVNESEPTKSIVFDTDNFTNNVSTDLNNKRKTKLLKRLVNSVYDIHKKENREGALKIHDANGRLIEKKDGYWMPSNDNAPSSSKELTTLTLATIGSLITITIILLIVICTLVFLFFKIQKKI